MTGARLNTTRRIVRARGGRRDTAVKAGSTGAASPSLRLAQRPARSRQRDDADPRVEARLDAALAATFPASDPVSISLAEG